MRISIDTSDTTTKKRNKILKLTWGIIDEVTQNWGKLSLTQREVVEHDFKDTDVVEGAAIVARFFTKRRVNLEVVANTLKSALKTELSFEIHDLPARRVTREVGERIGRTMDKVEEVDVSAIDNLLGKYIRVRIQCLETRGREDGTGVNYATVGISAVDLGPIEKGIFDHGGHGWGFRGGGIEKETGGPIG
ncbi:hypothetical protein CMV_011955 [Castanea mollissima]|uniref:Uncharacterized protein n=1 Tax=Castanea mollissima TaxID=60419 RepID=A0A8J4RBY4_9ROSI|nr:hypothetical protein CMV_011955 [Castanea mollissima]